MTIEETGPRRAADADAGADEHEVERLRRELAEERERRIVAETLAEERAHALEDARLALRALAASPPPNGNDTTEDDSRPRRRGNWLHGHHRTT
jgi:hypothetical protein